MSVKTVIESNLLLNRDGFYGNKYNC